jgi:hypothetical protein
MDAGTINGERTSDEKGMRMSGQVPPTASPDPARIESVLPPPASAVDQLHAEISRLTQVVTRLTDIAALQSEVRDLSKLAADQAAELEMYRRAAQAWAAAEITEADIERYAEQEPGLLLEAFIGELEQLSAGE